MYRTIIGIYIYIHYYTIYTLFKDIPSYNHCCVYLLNLIRSQAAEPRSILAVMCYYTIMGLYRDKGEENGNYFSTIVISIYNYPNNGE